MSLRGNWTEADVQALTVRKAEALKQNAERAKDQQVIDWCDARLRAQPAPKKKVRRAKEI
jgi:hypothetical protein